MAKEKLIRHALGKAKLEWSPWETGGKDRRLRYGTGLNGPENKGASVIVLEVLKAADGRWEWQVWPKNDYDNLLPAKFQHPMSGFEDNKALALRAAEKIVGLKSPRKAPVKKAKTKAKPKAKTKAKTKAKPKTKPKPKHWSQTAAGRRKHAERVAERKTRARKAERTKLKSAQTKAEGRGLRFLAGYGVLHRVEHHTPFSSSSIGKTWARTHARALAKRDNQTTQWIVWNNKTGTPVAQGTETYVKPADY